MPAKPPATPATSIELIAEAPVHRRAFLGWFGIGGTTTALAATLPATTAGAITQRFLNNRGQLMLNEVTHAEFAACIGNPFRLAVAAGQFADATLAEAALLNPGKLMRDTERRAPFSLLFRVPSEAMLPQQIYALEHPKLGRLEIFLVPVGRDGGLLLLEAIFN